MNGVPCPVPPDPLDGFGWVWGEWVKLLRRIMDAEERCAGAESDGERGAAANALDMLHYDRRKFEEECADGLKLVLRFLSDRDPNALAKAVATPMADAAALAAEHATAGLAGELVRLRAAVRSARKENDELRRELNRAREEVAGLRELARMVRFVAEELGWEGDRHAGGHETIRTGETVRAEAAPGDVPRVPGAAGRGV